MSADLQEQQYQYIQCVERNTIQCADSGDIGDVRCSVPLDILAQKLTLKIAKDVANMHDMYMPSRILKRDALMLLKNHKCQTCSDVLAVFKPYRVASNAEYQQSWYQKNKDKRAKYDKQHTEQSEYQELHKKSSQKHYQSKSKNIVKFPPAPPSAELCQIIISDFCKDTSPEVFEGAGCAVCGRLTPTCEMEELSKVENINLLNIDGVTKKPRFKSSDPVKWL